MNPGETLLDLVGEHRESIREGLDDEQHEKLLTRLRALAETAEDDHKAVRNALQGVRLALRPLAFDHPARLAVDAIRFGGAPIGPESVTGARDLLVRLTEPPPGPDTATIIRTAQDRLLEEPALNSLLMCARCHAAGFDEPPPELIRLGDAERGDRYPAFQFAGDSGGPIPLVLYVNRLLLADIDPWGAADWWLSGNTLLGGKPASLLGELPDEQLVGVATALVEGD
ncbi:hypothetical protein LHJ74_16985 [Streptomyces sp. N2-109]|uniref:Cytochrome c domain-containing protein n=1 Tax=Streptomyces gossypii TaxID=2883101 RepID=A0ABT2JV80_9ACTN|nr:hypothetical protein [Streptomyces gossypii]MCT2591573.1 hypothetical protein [Streptomyces gossypii]